VPKRSAITVIAIVWDATDPADLTNGIAMIVLIVTCQHYFEYRRNAGGQSKMRKFVDKVWLYELIKQHISKGG
jgi:hypothetical protein